VHIKLPRIMTVVKWLLALALAGYAAAVALLYALQRDMLYRPPQTVRTPPAAVGFAAEEVVLDTADGEKVIAWHVR
jgi:hypothetical protein